MSRINSLADYLSNGNVVTAKQIRSMFKLANPYAAVHRLRDEGFAIYTNRRVLSNGTETFAYRMGSPLNSGRRTSLYREVRAA